MCVVDDTAGFAAEEIFEVIPLGVLFFPMTITSELQYEIWPQVDR